MLRYLLSRLLLAIPTFLLAMAIIFLAIRLIPGDQLTRMIGEQVVSPADRAQLKHQLGFDAPLPLQYLRFVGGVAHGDLGRGTFDKQPVLQKIGARVGVTIELTVLSALISIAIAIPIGIISALKRNSPIDYLLRVFSLLALSIPSFWLGTMALVGLAIYFGWTPTISQTSLVHSPLRNLEQFALPSLVLGGVFAGSLMRITRSMMLEVLNEDYVRTARAKGLASRVVLMRHTIRNGLIPIITVIGLEVSALLGGAIVVEAIFGLPGLGTLFISALNSRDYPVIEGINAVAVVCVVGVNIVIDMMYPLIDPRVAAQHG